MNHIQEAFDTLKVERNFSEHTLKSYQDDLIQFNQFLEQEHLQLKTFEYRDARNYLDCMLSKSFEKNICLLVKSKRQELSMNIG